MFGRFKQRSAPTVDPLVNRSDPDLLLRQLEWTSIRKLDGQLQGNFQTLFRGSGLMLADIREYQAHDDVRHIDWNVTARMRTPFVREHQEDREISAWFLVDLTGSIDFGSGEVTKRALAIRYVSTLARLLTQHGNRVGAILYDGPDSIHNNIIPPRSGRKQVLHLIERMQNQSTIRQKGETDLNELLKLAGSLIKRRAAVFVVSDFISVAGWASTLQQLANRHDVVAARLMDPSEIRLPSAGIFLVEDIETGEQLYVDSDDSGFQQRFAQQTAAHEERIRETFTQASVDCLELDTSEAIDQSLIRFLRLRKRKKRPQLNRAQ